MGAKNLNSLANNLTESYISGMNYQPSFLFGPSAFAVDFIYKSLLQNKLFEMNMDILIGKIDAPILSSPTIYNYCNSLRRTIQKTLKSNKLESDFVVEAKIFFKIYKEDYLFNRLTAFSKITLKNGKVYTGKEYKIVCYPLPLTFTQSIKKGILYLWSKVFKQN